MPYDLLTSVLMLDCFAGYEYLRSWLCICNTYSFDTRCTKLAADTTA